MKNVYVCTFCFVCLFLFYFIFSFFNFLFPPSPIQIYIIFSNKSRGSSHDIREQSPDGTLRRQRFVQKFLTKKKQHKKLTHIA